MPPVTITGVSASARRPSSTPSRMISNPLPTEKKFGPVAAKTAISIRISRTSARSLPARFSTSISPRSPFEHNRAEDDGALNGLLPESVDAEESECGRDHRQDARAQQGAPERPLAASDRCAADY